MIALSDLCGLHRRFYETLREAYDYHAPELYPHTLGLARHERSAFVRVSFGDVLRCDDGACRFRRVDGLLA